MAALAVAVVLAACGKSGTPKTVGGPTTTSTSTTADFCTVARRNITETQPALRQDLQDVSTNPDAFQGRVRDDFQAADREYKDLAASAPTTIKTDMATVANAFDGYVKGLEVAGFDPAKVTPPAAAGLSSRAYGDANVTITAYVEQACGVSTPTTGTTTTEALSETPTTSPSSRSLRSTTTTVRPVRTTTTVRSTTSTGAPAASTTISMVSVPATTLATVPPTTTPVTEPPAPPTTFPEDG